MILMPVERGENAFANLRGGQPSAVVGDAQRRKTKAGGRDAGHPSRIARAIEVVARTVQDLTGLFAGLLPKEQACLPFEFIQKSIVAGLRRPALSIGGKSQYCSRR